MKTFTQIQGLMIAGSMFLVPLNLALRPYLTIFWWNWHLSRFQIHFFSKCTNTYSLFLMNPCSWVAKLCLRVDLEKKLTMAANFAEFSKSPKISDFPFFQFLMLDNLLSHHTYSVLMILAEGTTYSRFNIYSRNTLGNIKIVIVLIKSTM